MKIWLKVGKDAIQLPVIPAEVILSTSSDIEVVNIVTAGEVALKGTKKLRQISLSSFFPSKRKNEGYIKSAGATSSDPLTLATKIRKWEDNKEVVSLIVHDEIANKKMINDTFLISSFEYGQRDGTGDVYYNLSLTQFRQIAVKIVKQSKGALSRPSKPTTSKSTSATSSKKATATLNENNYITTANVNHRVGAGTNNKSKGIIKKNTEVYVSKTQKGGSYTWGYIPSTKTWIALKFAKKIVNASASPSSIPATYKVKSGDNFNSIAKKFYGTSSKASTIAKLNKMKITDKLSTGKTIKLR